MADKETKSVERRPLSKTARKAIQYLNEYIRQEMQDILESAAVEQGLDGAWQYDPKRLEWVRETQA